ncbi:MAG: ferrous iron transport protein A [Oscillospiraceae bacterium]|nr:ferrous iron transport protein A [Oscillospiraceae bacterium]
MKTTLSELKPGESAVITDIAPNYKMSRRLLDLGFIKDTLVMCTQISPLGDPTAFFVRGAVIALRAEDSAHIKIRVE